MGQQAYTWILFIKAYYNKTEDGEGKGVESQVGHYVDTA